jgi:hypothetical protein
MAANCHSFAPRLARGCGRAASRIPAFAGRRGKGYAVLLHCPGAERWHESAAFWIPHRVRDDRGACGVTGAVCGMTGVCVFPGLTRDPVMAANCHSFAPRLARGCGRAASRIPAFAGRRGKGYAVLLHCPGAERWHESAAFWIPHRVRDDRGVCGVTGAVCGMTGVCVFPGLTRDPVMATYCHDVAPRLGRGCGRAASRIPAFAGRRGKGYAVLLHCPGAERWHESAAFWIPHRVRDDGKGVRDDGWGMWDDRGACGVTGAVCGMTVHYFFFDMRWSCAICSLRNEEKCDPEPISP